MNALDTIIRRLPLVLGAALLVTVGTDRKSVV